MMKGENEFLLTSRDIASYTGKRHSDVLRDIRAEIEKWNLPRNVHFIFVNLMKRDRCITSLEKVL